MMDAVFILDGDQNSSGLAQQRVCDVGQNSMKLQRCSPILHITLMLQSESETAVNVTRVLRLWSAAIAVLTE